MKRPLTIWCLVAASLVGVVAWADLVLVLKSGQVYVLGAAINTAGDTLTVTMSGDTTLSDASGWSISFDNYAERTLTYSSGSGTSSIVFSIAANSTYTDINTDNDAAPVGTVATLSYDSGTGSVVGLESVTDRSVTNNSTAHPDPDLPEAVDTSLPANWNATADYTPADAAALQELLDGDGSGDATNGTSSDWTIIQLASDGTNYGPLTVDDSCQYILIRTDDYASLPSYGNRLLATDDGNGYLALFSRTPTASTHIVLKLDEGTGVAGVQHVRFIGCKFAMTGAFGTDITYMCGVGEENGTTDTTPLPEFIGFDRCLFTAADDIEVRDTLRLDATDSFVIGSRFENLHGAGNDGSTGVRCYVADRILIDDNYFETESAATFLGDNSVGLANDVTISSNYMTREVAWDDAVGVAKAAALETKVGRRVLFDKNSVNNFTWHQASFGAITIKADGSGGPKTTTHVTIRGCKVYNGVQAIVLHVDGSSPGATVGPNHDMLVSDCLVYDMTNSLATTVVCGDGHERVKFRHYTLLGTTANTRLWFEGSMYLTMVDNIFDGVQALNNGGAFQGYGAAAFNNSFGSDYNVTNNAFIGESTASYDSDTSPTPLGTLSGNFFPAATSSMGFANEAGDDYEITSGDYNAGGASDATDGTDLGCDVATLKTIMSGVEE